MDSHNVKPHHIQCSENRRVAEGNDMCIGIEISFCKETIKKKMNHCRLNWNRVQGRFSTHTHLIRVTNMQLWNIIIGSIYAQSHIK